MNIILLLDAYLSQKFVAICNTELLLSSFEITSNYCLLRVVPFQFSFILPSHKGSVSNYT